MMKKTVSIFLAIIIGISFVVISGRTLLAEPLINPKLKKHIDKAKLKNPKKYQEMIEKANGPIKDCLSCHADIFEKNNKSKKPRRR